jgi:AAA family ATP:ADP antiporter
MATANPNLRAAGSASEPTKATFREHPLEFFLALFGDVRPGEATTALLLTAIIFLLLTAYYVLKVAREPLILLGGGAEVKSYAAVGQSLLLVLVTNAYGWLAARVGRIVLIGCVTTFFAANLVVFWALGSHGVPLGVPFFLWVGIFNLVTVAQFWSLAADTYTEEQGKRLFPIIGIGSSVGAVGGATMADRLLRIGSPFLLMLVASGILLSTLALVYVVHRREVRRPAGSITPRRDEPLGRGNAFKLVVNDRYLLLLAALILVLNISTKTGDYVLDRMLIARATAHASVLGVSKAIYIGQFKARYFELINVLEVVLQSLVVSRVIKYAGLRATLVLVPLVSLSGYGATLLFPVIGVLFATRVAESTLDYSLSNTARQALWLVTSREAKYKAKQVVDSFVWRAGDTLSAAVVWTGSHYAMGPRGFLSVNVLASVAWVTVALAAGREYARRQSRMIPGTPEGGPVMQS